jgi:acylphosphatase
MVALRLTIKGKVQGIGFRWFAKQVAQSQAIEGTVKNLPNGDVEIFCQGSIYNLSLFTDAMRKGPKDAEVNSLDIKKTEDQGFTGFKIIN